MNKSMVLSLYLLVGVYMSHKFMGKLEKLVDKFEKGEKLNDRDWNVVKRVERINETVGGSTTITLIYSVMTLFWAPIKITKHILDNKEKK